MVLPPITRLCWVADCSDLGASGAGFLPSSPPAGLSAAAAPAAAQSTTVVVIKQASVFFTVSPRWRIGADGPTARLYARGGRELRQPPRGRRPRRLRGR